MSTHEHHILPLKIYLAVGFGLLVLTVITVAVSFADFGGFNLVVAMLIATIKATLVALYFMHLKYDNKLYLSIFVISLLFLAVFIVFTMFDTLNRGEINKERESPVEASAWVYKFNSHG